MSGDPKNIEVLTIDEFERLYAELRPNGQRVVQGPACFMVNLYPCRTWAVTVDRSSAELQPNRHLNYQPERGARYLMSNKHKNQLADVMRRTDISTMAKQLYVKLSDYRDAEPDVVLDIAELSRATNWGERTVYYCVNQLRDAGLVVAESRALVDGGKTITTYWPVDGESMRGE